MLLLSIETSCDETGVTVLQAKGKADQASFQVRGNALYSQAAKHSEYGGVYPTLAKREHAANLVPLLATALKQAGLYQEAPQQIEPAVEASLTELLRREPELTDLLLTTLRNTERPKVDAIAVTTGPGLEPALWIGVNFADALSRAWNIPVLPVNHLEGHVVASASTRTNDANESYTLHGTTFPVLALLISGGHTELVHAPAWGTYTVVGETRDDAVGEAYDKVARMLGLPYPGGLHIANLAREGRRLAHQKFGKPLADQKLPRPMLTSNDCDFSFSGLKTAVLYLTRELRELDEHAKLRIATEFEEAVVDVLLAKVRRALSEHDTKTFVLGGGVAANEYIRERLNLMLTEQWPDVRIQFPPKGLSTDNAVMIGMAGYLLFERNGKGSFATPDELRADGRKRLADTPATRHTSV